jgi:hypothetical protein
MTMHDLSTAHMDAQLLGLPQLAYSLAHINRHNARTLRPISEAEHALHTMDVLHRDYAVTDPCALLACLLHGAHVVFMGSPSPALQVMVGAAWSAYEASTRAALMRRWGVWTAYRNNQVCIHGASQFVESAEHSQLTTDGHHHQRALIEKRPAPEWLKLGLLQHSAQEWAELYQTQFQILLDDIAAAQRRYTAPQPHTTA